VNIEQTLVGFKLRFEKAPERLDLCLFASEQLAKARPASRREYAGGGKVFNPHDHPRRQAVKGSPKVWLEGQ